MRKVGATRKRQGELNQMPYHPGEKPCPLKKTNPVKPLFLFRMQPMFFQNAVASGAKKDMDRNWDPTWRCM